MSKPPNIPQEVVSLVFVNRDVFGPHYVTHYEAGACWFGYWERYGEPAPTFFHSQKPEDLFWAGPIPSSQKGRRPGLEALTKAVN